MPSQIRPKGDTDHKRHIPLFGKPVQVSHGKHDIIFLKTRCILADRIEFFQIRFCLLKLYHRDRSLRGSADKTILQIRTACRDAGEECSMPVRIHAWNDF